MGVPDPPRLETGSFEGKAMQFFYQTTLHICSVLNQRSLEKKYQVKINDIPTSQGHMQSRICCESDDISQTGT